MTRRKDGRVFLASLPASGIDGTLRRRMKAPPYRGRIRAKTGYITGVSCLSGYVLDDSGKEVLAFSILVNRVRAGNGWRAKQMQDRICRLLVDSVR